MQKQFSKNILLLLFINFLIKPLYIVGIDAQVQNQVGDKDYGVYFALFNFCFLFQIILDLGIQNYNSKYIAQAREKVTNQFKLVFGAKLILIFVFLFVVYTVGIFIGYPSSYVPLILGAGFIMVLQSMYIYIRSHFSALGYFLSLIHI